MYFRQQACGEASADVQALVVAAAFICTPIAVWDGDGPVWCSEGPKVRIANISARELDGSCRHGHSCPKATGIAARDALVALLGAQTGQWTTGHIEVRGQAMRCLVLGESYGRTIATCRLANGRDLGEAMIATGTVLHW